MRGKHVKGVNYLVETDNPGQMLQPRAAAAPTKSDESRAGVVHTEAHHGSPEQVAVLLAAVRDRQKLLGLNVLVPDGARGQTREVQGAAKDIAPAEVAGGV